MLYFLRQNKLLWAILPLTFVIALPILYLLSGLFTPADDAWQHITKHLLWDYSTTTLAMLVAMAFCTLSLGVPAAWVVAHYEFPFRKFFSFALVLPLAIPAYINAYCYKWFFMNGWVQKFVPLQIDFMTFWGAAWVMSSVLYPYIYLTVRSTFEQQTRSFIEASQLLGKSSLYTFFRITLPLARPAMIAGVLLVLMEGLNEYGTFKYYGIQTFTTGIFKAWFGMGSLTAAVRLAACLLLLVFILVRIEQWQRRKLRYVTNQTNKPIPRKTLQGFRQYVPVLICLVPFMAGFALPLSQLVYWASKLFGDDHLPDFLTLIRNSFSLALATAFVLVLLALVVQFIQRNAKTPLIMNSIKVASLGYAIPGAIIALGSMAVLIKIDRWLSSVIAAKGLALWLSGTQIGLIYAYLIRFFSVASNPIEAGFQAVSPNIDDASKLLGKSKLQTLWYVHLPLLRKSLLAALLMVLVDVLKELPLTLILRPFNFETLATAVFSMADDERLPAAAVASLGIITTSLLPIFLLNRLTQQRQNS